MKKSLFLAITLMANFTMAQSYSNGGLSTGSTTKNGTSAPAGYEWSELQNDNGNTTESNSNTGVTGVRNFFVADDFTIPQGEQWQISSIDFFGFQTNHTGPDSPFDKIRVNIFSSNPSNAGAVSVFGDDTTNRFNSSVEANIYRTENTSVPSDFTAVTTRKIWKITANVSTTLPAGTYWIKYQLENVVTSNNGLLPPVTIVGSRGSSTFNAQRLDTNTGIWTPLMDNGKPTSAPDVPIDFPFVITYTSGTLGANEVMQYDNRIQVYPNPVNDVFKISNIEKLKVNNIEITDISGRLIKNLKASEQYNVSDLPKGNYMVKIKSNETTKVTKLIKQ